MIELPKEHRPLFGDHAQIMVGAPVVHQLREWQRTRTGHRSPGQKMIVINRRANR